MNYKDIPGDWSLNDKFDMLLYGKNYYKSVGRQKIAKMTPEQRAGYDARVKYCLETDFRGIKEREAAECRKPMTVEQKLDRIIELLEKAEEVF